MKNSRDKASWTWLLVWVVDEEAGLGKRHSLNNDSKRWILGEFLNVSLEHRSKKTKKVLCSLESIFNKSKKIVNMTLNARVKLQTHCLAYSGSAAISLLHCSPYLWQCPRCWSSHPQGHRQTKMASAWPPPCTGPCRGPRWPGAAHSGTPSGQPGPWSLKTPTHRSPMSVSSTKSFHWSTRLPSSHTLLIRCKNIFPPASSWKELGEQKHFGQHNGK